jgi:hypothetical protein
MKLDFITYVGHNGADYAEYLKYTCEVFASGKHEIAWKYMEMEGAERPVVGYKKIGHSRDMGHNSLSHGVAMNDSLKAVENDYVVIIDADMAIVYQDWDDVIVNELNKNDVFGVGYGHNVKYRNFPTVYLFAFRSYILEKTIIDFTPKVTPGVDKPHRIRLNENEAKIFNMKPGASLKCDTGWKIPLCIKGAGFTKAVTLPMVMQTSKKAQLPFEDEKHKKLCLQKPGHMYEWHRAGKVFTTHKQASRVHPLTGIWGDAWKRKVDCYIRMRKK